MSFTDQKQRIATQGDLDAPWNGHRHRYFKCYLCGYEFKKDDYWRWVSGKGFPNLIVCDSCDGPDVLDKWKEANEKWELQKETGPYWWFIRKLEDLCEDYRTLREGGK